MFGFFEGVAFEGFGDFGIAFAVGLARHGQIHAYFRAFAVEVGGEVFYHFFVATFCHADFVFGYESEVFVIVDEFFEFRLGSAAEGALFGGFVAFVYVAADYADEFLFHRWVS